MQQIARKAERINVASERSTWAIKRTEYISGRWGVTNKVGMIPLNTTKNTYSNCCLASIPDEGSSIHIKFVLKYNIKVLTGQVIKLFIFCLSNFAENMATRRGFGEKEK